MRFFYILLDFPLTLLSPLVGEVRERGAFISQMKAFVLKGRFYVRAGGFAFIFTQIIYLQNPLLS
jgi:hypothetical protein